MENKVDSSPSEEWRKFWVVPPAQCKGNCDLLDAGGIECCHSCGWDDWIGNVNQTEEPKVVGARSSSDSQNENLKQNQTKK